MCLVDIEQVRSEGRVNILPEGPMVAKSSEVAMLLVYLAFSQFGRIEWYHSWFP